MHPCALLRWLVADYLIGGVGDQRQHFALTNREGSLGPGDGSLTRPGCAARPDLPRSYPDSGADGLAPDGLAWIGLRLEGWGVG